MNLLRAVLLASVVALGTFAAGPAPARADKPSVSDAASASASASTGAAGGDAFNFDLGDEKPKLTPAEEAVQKAMAEALDRKVKLRRKMLIAHQAIGFTTLGVLAATLVVGQLNYVSRYGSFNNGNDYDRFQNAHLGLAISSTALFTALGVLGVAAPNPYPKPIKADAALVHKVAMALATAGMVTQMILGPITTAYEGKLNQRNLALGHLVTGYATWGLMAAGTIAYTF